MPLVKPSLTTQREEKETTKKTKDLTVMKQTEWKRTPVNTVSSF